VTGSTQLIRVPNPFRIPESSHIASSQSSAQFVAQAQRRKEGMDLLAHGRRGLAHEQAKPAIKRIDNAEANRLYEERQRQEREMLLAAEQDRLERRQRTTSRSAQNAEEEV